MRFSAIKAKLSPVNPLPDHTPLTAEPDQLIVTRPAQFLNKAEWTR